MRALHWLAESARRVGDHPAIISGGAAVTYAELAQRSRAAAAWLRAQGVRRGDRVALLLPNGVDFAVLLHGATSLGAVAVPLGTRLVASELNAQLAAADCRVLCVDAHVAASVAAITRTPVLEVRLEVEHSVAVEPEPELDLDAPHSVVFTSGSSGAPKGVVLTAANHLASARGSAGAIGVRREDRWLACLPFSHVGGLSILLRSAIYGTTVVVHDRFDPARVNDAIDRQQVAVVSVVANMLQRMLDARRGRPYPASLRCVLLGGGPAPRALLEESARCAVPVASTYGLSEAASQVATLAPPDAVRRPGSVGPPLAGVELRIVAAERRAAVDEVGMIHVRGPMVSRGSLVDGRYIPRPNPWLATRDLGYLDADGHLHVVGRADEVIITGGENVHPREIEAVLEAHPSVAEACVFGLPDDRWGERVAARVRLRGGTDASAEGLIAHARARLAGFKQPRDLAVVDDFPRSPAGKILRRAARARALAEQG